MRFRFGPDRCPSAVESTPRACLLPSTEIKSAALADSFVKGFLVTSLVFSVAHGLFLGVILFVLDHNGQGVLAGVDWRSVKLGSLYVLIALAIDFVVDLPGLRRWSFWQIEQTANRSLGRVAVVHLTLVIGMFGAAMTDASALFGSLCCPQDAVRTEHGPATVGAGHDTNWLSRVMNRLPNVRPGQRFEDVWAKDRSDEAERRERNEQPSLVIARAVNVLGQPFSPKTGVRSRSWGLPPPN